MPPTNRSKIFSTLFDLFLLLLILLGVGFRFYRYDWNQGTNLHPDEYGLTNTLTALKMPQILDGYFNTRLSPISPYQKYDLNGEVTAYGPDQMMRWGQLPIILIRAAGELTGQTGYDEIRLLGRTLSAFFDSLTVLLVFLTGRRLYSNRVGLLAAALSALAVMQIQQAHFMTVDTFSVFFAALCLYLLVRAAKTACAVRVNEAYRPNGQALLWFALAGAALGCALACKINLLPLAGMVLVAVFLSVADLKLRSQGDFKWIAAAALAALLVTYAAAFLAFRVAQPMSFRNPNGDTSFFTFQFNPDWLECMRVSASESSGVGGGPPAEQWSNRPGILFPLINMVFWGMGLPLGLACWAGLLGAAWLLARRGESWRDHLLPLIWTSGYFLFMGTRWVTSIRYFLPIYPFLCLFAAWGLLRLWQAAAGKSLARRSVAAVPAALVLGATLAWAWAFISAVYVADHTRIQATRWVFQNIPAPLHLQLQDANGSVFYEPVGAPDAVILTPGTPMLQSFKASADGTLTGLILPHAAGLGGPTRLKVQITADGGGQAVISEGEVDLAAAGEGAMPQVSFALSNGALKAGTTYYIWVSAVGEKPASLKRSVVSIESWDEAVPMGLDGRDPWGQLYTGLTMEVRWYDDEAKRQMFLDTLAQVDYVILPSQRAIWSSCRIPLTYPMTMTYYRALFDGRLGFDLVGSFNAPMVLGPLQVSDVGGTFAWNQAPPLPVLNHNLLAAEEAFSVYDHPPVWVFKKRSDFNMDSVRSVLASVDLSKVIIQHPSQATGEICP
ncbi:MAG TPA: phospholipid carrier-dependent glycosyltransferase [Anaerolineaceae bacterium]|nr:phospholipid carrier-dependent glycosyltransferase [Anaerolineaceae bacterium]HPN50459.1 phospholipid carrier-dependent glycosyltransferase [Anaerolineaceae bacterium]